jgi:hypothetical protein
VAIFVFLWMPPPPPPEIVWPWWDSLVHTGLLLIFGLLWTWHTGSHAGPHEGPSRAAKRGAAGRYLHVLALGAVVGAVTEIGQELLPWERHASWDDFGFDLLGTLLGWSLARATQRAVAGARR